MRPYTVILITLLTGSAMYKAITIFTLLIIYIYVWPHSIIIACYEGEPIGEEYDKPFISGEKLFKNILMKMINIWAKKNHILQVGKLRPEVDFLATDVTSVRDGVGRVILAELELYSKWIDFILEGLPVSLLPLSSIK